MKISGYITSGNSIPILRQYKDKPPHLRSRGNDTDNCTLALNTCLPKKGGHNHSSERRKTLINSPREERLSWRRTC